MCATLCVCEAQEGRDLSLCSQIEMLRRYDYMRMYIHWGLLYRVSCHTLSPSRAIYHAINLTTAVCLSSSDTVCLRITLSTVACHSITIHYSMSLYHPCYCSISLLAIALQCSTSLYQPYYCRISLSITLQYAILSTLLLRY